MPFRAKVDGSCAICGGVILPGVVTTPIRLPISLVPSLLTAEAISLSESREGHLVAPPQKPSSRPPIQWLSPSPHPSLTSPRAHKECILDHNDERIPICKHWEKKGTCIFHEKCQFRHPPQDQMTNPPDRSSSPTRHGTWGRKRIYNEGRASALRRWVLKTFDLNDLSGGILDIAGGKGEISFEFLNLNQIQCTVIDPRPLDLFRFKRKLEFGFYHRNEVLNYYNQRIDPSIAATEATDERRDEPLSSRVACVPLHIRGYFEMFDSLKTGSILENRREGNPSKRDEIVELERLPLALRSPEEFAFQLERSQQTKWTKKGLQHEDEVEDEEGEEEEEDEGEEEGAGDVDSVSVVSSSCQSKSSNLRLREMEGGIEITNYDEACELVKNCAMVVGMHSDQVQLIL
jgi:hypothetical protein